MRSHKMLRLIAATVMAGTLLTSPMTAPHASAEPVTPPPGISGECWTQMLGGTFQFTDEHVQACTDPTRVTVVPVRSAAGQPASASILCDLFIFAPFPTEIYAQMTIRAVGIGVLVACDPSNGTDTMGDIYIRQEPQVLVHTAVGSTWWVDGHDSHDCPATNLCVRSVTYPCKGSFTDSQQLRTYGDIYALLPPFYIPPQTTFDGYSPAVGGASVCRPGLVPVFFPPDT
jgi:hypothetical protein